MKRFSIIFAAAAVFLAGCLTSPVTEVSDSQLNWLRISYKPANGCPPCRFDIVEAGYIHYISGKSPRVADDFAIDTENASWQDAAEEKIGVPPDVVRGWLQKFVDAGLVEKARKQARSKKATISPGKGVASFRAKINTQDFALATSDEELVAVVEELEGIVSSKGGK